MNSARVLLDSPPFTDFYRENRFDQFGRWPCSWISSPEPLQRPFVTAYRCRFSAAEEITVRVHVSADERYELFLDGARLGRGPERGDAHNWFFESYDLVLAAGEHVLSARVWSLGDLAPIAQMSVEPGFLCAVDDREWQPLLGTGLAPWEVKTLPGHDWISDWPIASYFALGACLDLDGAAAAWGAEWGEGDGWQPARTARIAFGEIYTTEIPARVMKPATLPPMLEVPRTVGRVLYAAEIAGQDASISGTRAQPVHAADSSEAACAQWQGFLTAGGEVEVPANSSWRIVIDLEDYYCFYTRLVVSGGAGALIRQHWAESLYLGPVDAPKGNRGEFDGKYFRGLGDQFRPDGGKRRAFEPLWWRCGRWLELVITTGEQPLTLHEFERRETRYPLEMESSFSASDSRLEDIIPMAIRAMQMCSHESYMDCPYYEQIMYVGDTRLEVLTTYTMTLDDALPLKALRMFDSSRLPSGLTQSRYPAAGRQVIPPFCLWWVGMVHDFALWRGDSAVVTELAPGMRAVLEYFLGRRNDAGLVEASHGWNFVDWVPEWDSGIPAGAKEGVSGLVNWQFVLALDHAAKVEDFLGEPIRAEYYRVAAKQLVERLQETCWDEARGLFADDAVKAVWSEHAQVLSLLSGHLPPSQAERVAQGLLTAPDLSQTTIYFTYYLFEAYRQIGRMDVLLKRLELWFQLKELDFKTTVEAPEPSRSDCHAWGAHPVHHYFTSVLGIRPAEFGFKSVEVAPQLGTLSEAQGVMPHPLGEIRVGITVAGSALHARITLPEGLPGTFRVGTQTLALKAGEQEVVLPLE